ncbi:ATP dependent DNA ligase [Caballeronia arationis]|uniref:ATP-dependent DNA ligase n=1 Tax=Caballeronia arationis TaxID=1777142 RepID=UPI00074C99E5|nr:DNA ligase [Caballeronia arationis]SAL05476.1 ATP dependent DNA ligase [Caballeronia arationis]
MGEARLHQRTAATDVSAVPLIDAKDLMLASLQKKPFSREEWVFELKYDGFRCLVRKVGNRVDLISRPGNSLNRSFPDIVEAVWSTPGDFIWDTELTVDHPDGRSAFDRLQQRARTSVASRVRAAMREHPARLYVFDMLADGERDIRHLPLVERKQILRDSFENTQQLIYVVGIVGAGTWVFDQVKDHDMEGMVAKRLDSTYQRGRSRDWIKIKDQDYSRPAALGFGREAQT